MFHVKHLTDRKEENMIQQEQEQAYSFMHVCQRMYNIAGNLKLDTYRQAERIACDVMTVCTTAQQWDHILMLLERDYPDLANCLALDFNNGEYGMTKRPRDIDH